MTRSPIHIVDTGGHHAIDVPESQLFGGVAGLITCNRIVYMTPGLSRWSVDPAQRLYKEEYAGIFCTVNTSMGLSLIHI